MRFIEILWRLPLAFFWIIVAALAICLSPVILIAGIVYLILHPKKILQINKKGSVGV